MDLQYGDQLTQFGLGEPWQRSDRPMGQHSGSEDKPAATAAALGLG